MEKEKDTEMLLDTDRDKNIDLMGKKVSIFCCSQNSRGKSRPPWAQIHLCRGV